MLQFETALNTFVNTYLINIPPAKLEEIKDSIRASICKSFEVSEKDSVDAQTQKILCKVEWENYLEQATLNELLGIIALAYKFPDRLRAKQKDWLQRTGNQGSFI